MPKKNEKFSNGSWPPHYRTVYLSEDVEYPNYYWTYLYYLSTCNNHRNTIKVKCETMDDEPKQYYEYDVCDYCGKIMDYKKIEK